MAIENLSDFITTFQGGARAYLFELNRIIGAPADFKFAATSDYNTKFLVKSTSLPGTSIDEISTYWMGAEKRYAGGIKFNDWTCSFNVDRKFDLKTQFTTWIDYIHNVDDMSYGDPGFSISSNPSESGYVADIYLKLYDYGVGSTYKEFMLANAWPKSVGDATLDHGSQEILTFDVTFSYLYSKWV